MKMTTRILALVVACCCYSSVYAQEPALTKAEKEQAIQTLSQLMNDFYVFPEVAKATEEHLLQQWEDGHFAAFNDHESFADALTESVQSINKDKHMRIRARRTFVAAPNTPEERIEEQLDRIERSRNANFGFNTVEVLEGNVGYLDLRGFAGLERAKPLADATMALLARTDAVIVDLTKNGGGSPRMVQYLCSFFFDKKVHLNSLYWRQGDTTEEFWTLDEIGGEKMPDVPLFVMTSEYTFSGAEEFSYNMQTQKRATLVGQTTGGGANPGGTMRINENLFVFIPSGRAINPITGTNWEGVGVVPEQKVAEGETYDTTLKLAQQAAENYRNQRKTAQRKMLTELNESCTAYTSGKSDALIFQNLEACTAERLLSEGDINAMGYEHLLEHKKPQIALAIFKANTQLYPNSANTYDSFAEALMMSNKLEAAVENYEKAVALATANEDGNLELFQQNLATAKNKLAEGK